MQTISKNIFITGGSSGIGLALTQLFLHRGDRVGVLARDSKKWQDNPLSSNNKTSFHAADITNQEEVQNAMHDFSRRFGPIDIVIANAGMGNSHKTAIPNFDVSEKIFKINILGTLYTIQTAFELMYPRRQGQITIISSVAGYVGLAGNAAYCASKSALHKMAESYAIDFYQYGITVMCVSPGFVHTPLTAKNNHQMPFVLTAEKAAQYIIDGIEKKKNWIGFPWQLYSFMAFISLMPRSLYIWISKKLNINLYKKK